MDGIGSRLRAARVRWQLTLREVEERSLRLAQQWGSPAYQISASWLDRIERVNRALSARKLIVLAFIYGLTAEQMLSLFCRPAPALPNLAKFRGQTARCCCGKGRSRSMYVFGFRRSWLLSRRQRTPSSFPPKKARCP